MNIDDQRRAKSDRVPWAFMWIALIACVAAILYSVFCYVQPGGV